MRNVLRVVKGMACVAFVIGAPVGIGWIATHVPIIVVWNFLCHNVAGIVTGMGLLSISWLLGGLIEKIFSRKGKDGMPPMPKT